MFGLLQGDGWARHTGTVALLDLPHGRPAQAGSRENRTRKTAGHGLCKLDGKNVQRIIDEIGRMFTKRNFRAIIGKSKVMVYERARGQTISFTKA